MPEDPTTDAEPESQEENEQFVAESSRRTDALKRLAEGPAAASTVARSQSVSIASTQSAKSASEQMRERGLVELLVTDEEKAYGLTAKGERVLFSLERQGKV